MTLEESAVLSRIVYFLISTKIPSLRICNGEREARTTPMEEHIVVDHRRSCRISTRTWYHTGRRKWSRSGGLKQKDPLCEAGNMSEWRNDRMACTMLYLDDPFFSVVVGRLFIYLFPLLWSRIPATVQIELAYVGGPGYLITFYSNTRHYKIS